MNGSRPHHDAATPFDPVQYWSDLVQGDLTLDMVGNVGCGLALNQWIYRQKVDALTQALKSCDVDLRGKSIFEAAFGIGFYLRRWADLGASHVAGIDLSAPAVDRAQRLFPQYDLRCGDLARLDPPETLFDIVFAIDVLYHIVDDQQWREALVALAARVKRGGHLVFTDQFWPSRASPTPHVRRRTWTDYVTTLESAGFSGLQRHVFTRFLGHDIPSAASRSTAFTMWRTFYRGARLAVKAGLGEFVGERIGRMLYFLEKRFPGEAGHHPCLELVITQKGGSVSAPGEAGMP